MGYSVWVKCMICRSESAFPTILEKTSSEQNICPGCEAPWQKSRIIAKVFLSEKSADHIIWM